MSVKYITHLPGTVRSMLGSIYNARDHSDRDAIIGHSHKNLKGSSEMPLSLLYELGHTHLKWNLDF